MCVFYIEVELHLCTTRGGDGSIMVQESFSEMDHITMQSKVGAVVAIIPKFLKKTNC